MSREDLIKPGDLTPLQRHENAKKAGSVSSLAKKISRRKICTMKCPIYERCWAKFMKNEDEKGRAKCSLNDMPKRVVQRTLRIYKNGEDGLRDELADMLIRFSNDVEVNNDMKSKRAFLYEIRECMKVLYGDKKKVEMSGMGNITFVINKPEGDLPDIDFEKKKIVDADFSVDGENNTDSQTENKKQGDN